MGPDILSTTRKLAGLLGERGVYGSGERGEIGAGASNGLM